ncbi:MAG TPA: hypothetical protein VH599_11520 [Ktedonobacterales bacterium]|jgi:hypothetical protein
MPMSFIPLEPDEKTKPEKQEAPEPQIPQPPAGGYPNWHDEAPTLLRDQQQAAAHENNTQAPAPPVRPAPVAAPEWGPAAPAFLNQPEHFSTVAENQAFAPESARMAGGHNPREIRPAPPAWAGEPPAWERRPQEVPPEQREDRPWSNQPPSAQNYRSNLNQNPFDERASVPPSWQAPPAERPIRPATRGPVPGAFQKPRPPKQHRLPLGVIITLGLLLVFVVAGVGVYAFVSGSGSLEPSAFQTYTDSDHHFSIQYPTVWTLKQLPNGARFANTTNTAELSVTYTPNTSNLTAEQFADQEAAKENISTPDTQTFAGTTWVVRSGIVTQTSGISQDIFLFVTVSNNLLYEVREVAPLDGYKEPNQTAFMPMLKSLKLT